MNKRLEDQFCQAHILTSKLIWITTWIMNKLPFCLQHDSIWLSGFSAQLCLSQGGYMSQLLWLTSSQIHDVESVNTRALPATQDVTQRVKDQGRGINKCRLVSETCNPWFDSVSQRSALMTSVYGHESQHSGISYTRKSPLWRVWNPLELWEQMRTDQSSECVCARAKTFRIFRVI